MIEDPILWLYSKIATLNVRWMPWIEQSRSVYDQFSSIVQRPFLANEMINLRFQGCNNSNLGLTCSEDTALRKNKTNAPKGAFLFWSNLSLLMMMKNKIAFGEAFICFVFVGISTRDHVVIPFTIFLHLLIDELL